MKKKNSEAQFVVCVKNDDYTASLEVRKIYRVIPDDGGAKHQLVRIVDESGEDYLYPVDYFVPIELPESIVKVLSLAA